VDPIDAVAERRIREAMERGEFEQGATYEGQPLPDIDTPRPPGWWAARLVAEERARTAADDPG
jgi:DnaJ homologue, subfamily C, member 28, conserved domain